MGIVEVWERRKSSSEYSIYESSLDSSYEESEKDSDYERRYKSIDLFDNELSRKYRDDSDVEERRLKGDDAEEKKEDEGTNLETEYSDEQESETDVFEYANEWERLQYIRAYGRIANDAFYNFDIVPRTWLSVFYISSVHNMENVPQNYFYSIKVGHVNPHASSSFPEMKMYTPLYSLKEGERYTFTVPIFLWKRKKLTIPYGEFKNYIVKIDMWKKHKFTLNTLHATQTLTFFDIINNKSSFTMSLNMTVPKIKEGEKEKNAITEESENNIPLHKLNVVMLLEEIFDFLFVFENWWFTKNANVSDAAVNAPKTIKISMQTSMGGRWVTKTAMMSYDDYWASPGHFTFTGTFRQLKISYFTVKVYSVTKKFWRKSVTLLGTCVMSLKSVREYPLVRGIVKKLAIGTQNMQIGTIQGNIRCSHKSAGLQHADYVKKRLVQPISGSALLTHLDKSCQYLVIRLLRCENLPATNTDTYSSDPLVKVKWDGIVNFTCTMESTTSPVYNQNMYFPIHLVDTSELVIPPLVKYSLPMDLASKGPVIMEVWDSEDTSSEFLGAVEVPLYRLFNEGYIDSRSLVDGIYTEPSKQPLGNKDAGDQNDFVTYSGFSNDIDKRYETKVYSDTLTLTGYTVPHRGAKPSITFEMYILPPMPIDLKIPNDKKRQIKSDTYRDLRRRWDREFDLWQKMYRDQTLSNFPHRRFLSTTANNALSSDVFPSEVILLSRFVTPIQVSSVLRPPGHLLHWISNFGLKDDSVERLGDLAKIESWQHPSRFLTTRKGGLHDRTLLLCSCLLGLGYDAYVCKGTVKGGMVEHCWVMTRHSDSTVSFWETGNKKITHLPKRWNMASYEANMYEDVNEAKAPLLENYQAVTFQPSSDMQRFQQANQNTHELTKFEMYGSNYVPDQKVDLKALMHRQDEVDFDTSAITENLNKLLYENPQKKLEFGSTVKKIRPREDLLIPNETLVPLPYSSIETVFNNKQLWGNIQNHHPSCILYDLEDPSQWKPFLKVPLENEFLSNIQVTEPPSDYTCHETARDIVNEVGDMIELMRAQRGLRCSISKDLQMHEHLDKFLEVMEFRQKLDPQFDPGMPPNLLGWSNRKKLKRMIKNEKGQMMLNEMQKSALLEYEDSEPSTEASATKSEKAVEKEGDEEDQQPYPEDGEENKQEEQGLDTQEQKQEQPDQQGVVEQDGVEGVDDQPEVEKKEEPVRNKKSSRRRSRSGRRHRRHEKKSKPLDKIAFDNPKHSCSVISALKRCSITPKGIKIKVKRQSKHVKIPKCKGKIVPSYCAAFEDVVQLEVPDVKLYSKFSPLSVPSSPGLSRTPMSDMSKFSEKCEARTQFSEIIRAVTHRMNPPMENRAPVSNRIRMKVEKRNLKLINKMNQPAYVIKGRKSVLSGIISRVKKVIPDLYRIPGFMDDMQKVIPRPEYYSEYVYSNYAIPQEFKVFEKKETSSWYWYYENEARHYAWQKRLPVMANHTFIGIPIHFCTSDVNEIMNLLCSDRRFKRFLVNKVDDSVFVIYARVFPLVGNILSTWVFIGCHIPWRI
ncbi:uncharacterized protein TOT_020000156 [Theileria orientalis strain Shintoku]|uniref:C2 domain-containing protein n=1 Tax=Theileria orientalis strain Shintoku TaxID=869250 RepID=J4DP08_THEOR|nr:uncharacterized protein TOT_020000156 [Theileria orientalis strain Shintoku]PVC53923.1 hypothetical protein MACL_00003418 [Theileria orientalis]BAM39884.1 uncharacterized protein TOT_020000156 [Theileria orientalis strain Shintoku]|eukprot:XP_009690185.1 uncharacterized protein TOT_020000156 [Theileria orientalis strain Shintoku]